MENSTIVVLVMTLVLVVAVCLALFAFVVIPFLNERDDDPEIRDVVRGVNRALQAGYEYDIEQDERLDKASKRIDDIGKIVTPPKPPSSSSAAPPPSSSSTSPPPSSSSTAPPPSSSSTAPPPSSSSNAPPPSSSSTAPPPSSSSTAPPPSSSSPPPSSSTTPPRGATAAVTNMSTTSSTKMETFQSGGNADYCKRFSKEPLKLGAPRPGEPQPVAEAFPDGAFAQTYASF